jgi:hypothetical protein
VSYQYSAGVQQAIGPNAVLNVAYVGSQGRRENYYQAINLPPLSELPAEVVAGKTDYTTLTYPGIGQMRLAYNGANSSYNSLQTSLTGTVRHDLHLQVSYTLAKAMDATVNSGSGGDLQNVQNPYVGWRGDWGPSVYDRRNVFFANFVYDLPFLRNSGSRLMKSTLGGWQLSAIITEESGSPLNIGYSGIKTINNGNTPASVISNIANNGTVRPNITGSVSYPKTTASWFNTSVFSAPPCATGPDCFGNLGFDAVTGPGHNNFDLSLMKNFAFTERFRMEFRVEAFNAFNHTQFQGNADIGGISTNLGAADFGQVKNAYDGRQLQLGLKLMF